MQGLQTEDGGLYTCFGRNEYGHDQTQISLLVQGVPPTLYSPVFLFLIFIFLKNFTSLLYFIFLIFDVFLF